MSSIERYGASSQLRTRDARLVARRTSSTVARTTTTIAEIDGAGDVWEEILIENTRLTASAMRHALEIGRVEEIGSEMAPGAAHRLTYLADEHAMAESVILGGARRSLGRLAQ